MPTISAEYRSSDTPSAASASVAAAAPVGPWPQRLTGGLPGLTQLPQLPTGWQEHLAGVAGSAQQHLAAQQARLPPDLSLQGLLSHLGSAAACDCCSNAANLDAGEAGVREQPMEGNDAPALDYEDSALGMYAPRMPKAVLERANASVPAGWSATGMSGKGNYSVSLQRLEGERLGLDVDYKPDRVSLPIVGVTGGMAERWNNRNPETMLTEGDCIIEVNGMSRDPAAMVQMCQSAPELHMVLVRGNGQQPASREAQARRNCLACVACPSSRAKLEEARNRGPWGWLQEMSVCAP